MSHSARLVLFALAVLAGAVLAYNKVISGDAWLALTIGLLVPSPLERGRPRLPPPQGPAGPLFLMLALLGAPACDRGFFVAVAPFPAVPVETKAPPLRVLSTDITPITTLSAPKSGFPYAGESYDVACSVSGSVTLYPAVHDGTSWFIYQGYPCALASSVAAEGTCTFPALQDTGLVYNAYKTGAGTVSGCTASGRQGPVPAGKSAAGGGGGGTGTVTSVGLSLPAEFAVSGSPVTTAGTLTGTWAAQSANTVFAGPTSGAAATPSFRALTANDIPSRSGVYVPVTRTLTAGTGLSGGGDLSANRTFALADTTVTPGTYTNATLTVNQQGQLTFAASGGATYWWIYDAPLRGAALGSPASAGDYTTGWLFRVYTALPITGVRVYWAGTAATLYCSLWDSVAAQLARKDIIVAGSGLATATFGAAITPTPGQTYYVGCYESTGTTFPGGIPDPNNPGATVQNGPWTLITPTYAAGDNAPTSDAGWAYPYPVRAVFVGEP